MNRAVSVLLIFMAGCAMDSKYSRTDLPKPDAHSAGSTNLVTNFNSKGNPFSAYDKKIIKAVQARWYGLVERFHLYRRGEVSVAFQICSDGEIRELRVTKTTAHSGYADYCIQAVAESAPFDALPGNLNELVGDQPRDATFTFYY